MGRKIKKIHSAGEKRFTTETQRGMREEEKDWGGYFQGPQVFQLTGKGPPALKEVKTGFKKMAIAASVLGFRSYSL